MTHQFAVLTQPQAETIAYTWHYEGDYPFTTWRPIRTIWPNF